MYKSKNKNRLGFSARFFYETRKELISQNWRESAVCGNFQMFLLSEAFVCEPDLFMLKWK